MGLRSRAVVAGALLVVLGAGACSSDDPSGPGEPGAAAPSGAADPEAVPVSLPPDDPALDDAGRAACAALLAAAPDRLAGQARRTDVTDPLAASWGDPAIELRCGVAAPEGFDPTVAPGVDEPAPCTVVSRVGWYVPPDQVDGEGDAVLTAVTWSPRIAVLVPQEYLPEGSAAALAELAEPVRSTLARSLRCG